MSSGSCSGVQLERLLNRALSGTAVHLSDAFLSDQGCERLCQLLENDAGITALDLRGNNIESGGLTALAHLIRHHKHLKKLSVQWNPIGSYLSSFMTFMDAIAVNRSLTTLDLRNCKLSSDAGSAIGQMLSRNTSLKQLDLRWNSVDSDGSIAIQSGLDNNDTLVEMQLSGNNIPVHILTSISERCQQNRSRQRSPSPTRTVYPSASVLDESFRFSQERLDALRGDNTNLKLEIADLQAELSSKADHAEQLHQLQSQYDDAERDWQAKNKAKQSELDHLQQSLNESSWMNQQLQSDLQRCSEQLETSEIDSKRHQDSAERIRDALTAEITALNEQMEKERRAAVDRLEIVQKKLNDDISQRMSELNLAEQLQRDERIRYETELERIKEEMERRARQTSSTIQKLSDDCKQKSEELIDLQDRYTKGMFQADDNFKRLQQQMADQHQRELASKTSVFETRIIQLEGCRDELQQRLSGVQGECDRVKDQLEQNRVKHEHALQLERIERSNLEFQLKAALNDANRKESEIAAMSTETRRLKDEIRSITARAEADIEARIASKTRKIDELVERLGAKDDQMERMSRELQHLESANRQIRDERDRRDSTIRSAILGLRDVFESEIGGDDVVAPSACSSTIQSKPRKSRTENRMKKLGYDDVILNKP